MRMNRAIVIPAFLILLGAAAAAAAAPNLGAHTLSHYFLYAHDFTHLVSSPMTTMATGSTILVSVGRGSFSGFSDVPTDNMGNGPYTPLGTPHRYTLWGGSGTALYACADARGGSGHVVSVATPVGDEITLAAVEIVNGGVIQDFQWNEVPAGHPLTSQSVTTTGPATLVAFWWGDSGGGPHTATPNNGFVVTDALLLSGWIVQCAAATKTVSEAGTYNVTWTSTPLQGAQLWLAAVQSAATSAVPGAGAGSGYSLDQNHPNPFNPSTTIGYAIPGGARGHASLRVYDMSGREVATLVDGVEEPGRKSVQFDASNLASGVYFYRLLVQPADPSAQGFADVKRFVLLE